MQNSSNSVVGASNGLRGGVARLALADGSVFSGEAFGAVGRGLCVDAEVVFNTALTGYQESLTDPSYARQILVQTTPLIGNTGVNPEDEESAAVRVSGFVVHELARRHSNFRANASLEAYLAGAGVLGLAGVDTRALTRKLRTRGVVPGVLTDRADLSDTELVSRAASAEDTTGQNLVPMVGCSSNLSWSESLGDWRPALLEGDRGAAGPGASLRVIALDCGVKRNILRHLTDRGCSVEVVPHDVDPGVLIDGFGSGVAHGLFISNGPGDPSAVEATIGLLRRVVVEAERPPATFGICLGHQLLALAFGARTYKLPFGHRGSNQPVLSGLTERVEITSHNHGYAVDRSSLEAVGAVVTHVHLNDGTVSGFRVKDRPVLAVQYHPEASPGPHDSGPLFDAFVEMMRSPVWAGLGGATENG